MIWLAKPIKRVAKKVPKLLYGQIALIKRQLEDMWSVFDVYTDGRKATATCVLPASAREGDTVELLGEFVETKYGPQFKASACVTHLSGDSPAIVEWLKNSLPQVGDQRAQEIVKKFRHNLWQVLEQTPERLDEIPGLTGDRVQEIVKAYQGVRSQRDQMLKLVSAGLTMSAAAKTLSELGRDAWKILSDNPYDALMRRRVPFEIVDKVAQKLFSIGKKDPKRICAYLHQELMQRTYTEGHCYSMTFEIVRATSNMLQIGDPDVLVAIRDYGHIVVQEKFIMLLEIVEAERAVTKAVLERVS